jgi:hypothetical protein
MCSEGVPVAARVVVRTMSMLKVKKIKPNKKKYFNASFRIIKVFIAIRSRTVM